MCEKIRAKKIIIQKKSLFFTSAVSRQRLTWMYSGTLVVFFGLFYTKCSKNRNSLCVGWTASPPTCRVSWAHTADCSQRWTTSPFLPAVMKWRQNISDMSAAILFWWRYLEPHTCLNRSDINNYKLLANDQLLKLNLRLLSTFLLIKSKLIRQTNTQTT